MLRYKASQISQSGNSEIRKIELNRNIKHYKNYLNNKSINNKDKIYLFSSMLSSNFLSSEEKIDLFSFILNNEDLFYEYKIRLFFSSFKKEEVLNSIKGVLPQIIEIFFDKLNLLGQLNIISIILNDEKINEEINRILSLELSDDEKINQVLCSRLLDDENINQSLRLLDDEKINQISFLKLSNDTKRDKVLSIESKNLILNIMMELFRKNFIIINNFEYIGKEISNKNYFLNHIKKQISKISFQENFNNLENLRNFISYLIYISIEIPEILLQRYSGTLEYSKIADELKVFKNELETLRGRSLKIEEEIEEEKKSLEENIKPADEVFNLKVFKKPVEILENNEILKIKSILKNNIINPQEVEDLFQSILDNKTFLNPIQTELPLIINDLLNKLDFSHKFDIMKKILTNTELKEDSALNEIISNKIKEIFEVDDVIHIQQKKVIFKLISEKNPTLLNYIKTNLPEIEKLFKTEKEIELSKERSELFKGNEKVLEENVKLLKKGKTLITKDFSSIGNTKK